GGRPRARRGRRWRSSRRRTGPRRSRPRGRRPPARAGCGRPPATAAREAEGRGHGPVGRVVSLHLELAPVGRQGGRRVQVGHDLVALGLEQVVVKKLIREGGTANGGRDRSLVPATMTVKERLDKIVRDFPGTPTAEEAKRLRADLDKR